MVYYDIYYAILCCIMLSVLLVDFPRYLQVFLDICIVLSLKATILRSFGPPREGHALEAHFHHFEAVSKRAVF